MPKRSYLRVGGLITLSSLVSLQLLSVSSEAAEFRVIDGDVSFIRHLRPGAEWEYPGYRVTVERISNGRVEFSAESPEHITVRTSGGVGQGTTPVGS